MKKTILFLTTIFLFSAVCYAIPPPADNLTSARVLTGILIQVDNLAPVTVLSDYLLVELQHLPVIKEKSENTAEVNHSTNYNTAVTREVVRRPKDSDFAVSEIITINDLNNTTSRWFQPYKINRAEMAVNKRKQNYQADKQHCNYAYPFTGNRQVKPDFEDMNNTIS